MVLPLALALCRQGGKVIILQSGYCACTVKHVALSLVSTKCWQGKDIVALSCHSDIFANKCVIIKVVILSVNTEYRSFWRW